MAGFCPAEQVPLAINELMPDNGSTIADEAGETDAARLVAELSLEPLLWMIEVLIEDQGKGIPDVEQAMQEGFTTSTEEMRAMGFGAGMGLPNIKRNTDEFEIDSEVGVGTTLRMKFDI